ncbi:MULTISPECIES: hypothetical protein [Streptomyces]|uniref:ATP-binding protein n=1 Tax=Streptomyces cacaoi TaxID=1898 RepID=A0A4Y3QZV4_STRCI|nr:MULTISPECIES: hypothetical protein [Streptomyces]NNG83985.1 hypothetical protein [Streptomyces cacaoi]QHF96958.1 hypothetical protein DEH18_27415 [Streptomyces sp. NHF165]GEB50519.1 hypothetical protein SCA03_30700 [Streptomyces cacaoi]
MKYSKTAAAVAGSVMALGAAAPAVADQAAPTPNFSLNGGLQKGLQSETLDAAPIDGPQVRKVSEGVKGTAAQGAEQGKQLLGGLLGGLPLKSLPVAGGLLGQ